MVIIPKLPDIHGLAPPTTTSFYLELPCLPAGTFTPEQAGWISSSHHSCISLPTPPDVYNC